MGRFAGCGIEGFGGRFMFPFPWFGVILIAVGLYMFYRTTKANNKNSDVLEILNMKYANGEIDEETYLKKKSIISGKTKL